MKKWIICGIAALSLVTPLLAEAREDVTDKEYEAIFSDTETEKRDSETDKKKEETRYRYKKIFVDQNFTYYVDTKNMCWVNCPNANDQIIDVWVKLVNFSEYYGEGEEAGQYTANYFLEHYYIRPKTQQIQFLGELEVHGRPTNRVKERKYSASNWENLVPGSIEDTIYHGVMDNIADMPNKGKKSDFASLGDGLEDVFHIAL